MTYTEDLPVALARGLIRCPSVTPFDAGALDVLEATLTPAGFRCQRLPFSEEGTPPSTISMPGSAPIPHLCFAGHTEWSLPARSRCGPIPLCRRDRGRRALRPRGLGHEGRVAAFAAAALDFRGGRARTFQARSACSSPATRKAPRSTARPRCSAWMAEHGERPDHASSANRQLGADRRNDQDRPARQPERPLTNAGGQGSCRLSPSRQ